SSAGAICGEVAFFVGGGTALGWDLLTASECGGRASAGATGLSLLADGDGGVAAAGFGGAAGFAGGRGAAWGAGAEAGAKTVAHLGHLIFLPVGRGPVSLRRV